MAVINVCDNNVGNSVCFLFLCPWYLLLYYFLVGIGLNFSFAIRKGVNKTKGEIYVSFQVKVRGGDFNARSTAAITLYSQDIYVLLHKTEFELI